MITSIQVAKGLRMEIRRNETDTSSVLVCAHRRIVGEILSSRCESRLALGQIWLAMMDGEAGVDSAPELAETHLRLGAVYEAAGVTNLHSERTNEPLSWTRSQSPSPGGWSA